MAQQSRGNAITGPGAKTCVPAASRIQHTTRTVATIRKNNLEEIRVGLIERSGFAMVDMRVFAAPCGAQDEPRPTKNGICIPHTQLPRLIEALQIAEREASR